MTTRIEDLDEGQIPALSTGIIEGGWTPSMPAWRKSLDKFMNQLSDARRGVQTPLNVNVIFHVRGNLVQPDFEGVRTGYYGKKENCLIVQVAVPEVASDDPDEEIWRYLSDAVAEAERWARRRKIAEDLSALRQMVSDLRPSSGAHDAG